MIDATCTSRYAELLSGPVYTSDAKLIAQIEPYIPSVKDQIGEFRKELHRIAPSVECVPLKGMWRYTIVDGVQYEREKRYLKLIIDHECIQSGRIADAVRSAYHDGARVLAQRIAMDVPKDHVVTVRWKDDLIMANFIGGDGATRRICLDHYSDDVSILLGSYYVICPPGEELLQ